MESKPQTKPAPDTGERLPTSVEEQLASAAALAAAEGSDLDGFMRAAWNAFVDARPGLRKQLEELRLIEQFEQLRQSGRLPSA